MDCFKGLKTFFSPSCKLICTKVCLKLQSGLLGKIHSSFAYFLPKKEYPMNACICRIIQTINIRKNDATINKYWDHEKLQLFFTDNQNLRWKSRFHELGIRRMPRLFFLICTLPWVMSSGYSIYNPYTPCGRFQIRYSQGECNFQVD